MIHLHCISDNSFIFGRKSKHAWLYIAVPSLPHHLCKLIDSFKLVSLAITFVIITNLIWESEYTYKYFHFSVLFVPPILSLVWGEYDGTFLVSLIAPDLITLRKCMTSFIPWMERLHVLRCVDFPANHEFPKRSGWVGGQGKKQWYTVLAAVG